VEQAQLELQLKVWKELAISKQMLMRTATDALKLDPNCSQDELKVALETFIARIAKADADVAAAQQEAKQSIAAMEKTLASSEKAKAIAEAQVGETQAAQEKLIREIAAERAGFTTELQKMKERVLEKEKALKAVNVALADTPENVIKKMNTLKKQKQDEADARRQVEASFNSLRKEKQQQDQKLTSLQESSAKLIAQYRDLHALSGKLHEQLTPLVKDEKDAPTVPELDTKLIEAIENPDAKPEAKTEGKGKAEGKGKRAS
jgi:colicin import membrane protein